MQHRKTLNQSAPAATTISATKTAYTAPVISEYGSIRALTRSVGMMGNLDRGTMQGMRRTNA